MDQDLRLAELAHLCEDLRSGHEDGLSRVEAQLASLGLQADQRHQGWMEQLSALEKAVRSVLVSGAAASVSGTLPRAAFRLVQRRRVWPHPVRRGRGTASVGPGRKRIDALSLGNKINAWMCS